jgi:hypothetical protein
VIDNNKYVGNRSVCQRSIASYSLSVEKNVYTLAENCPEITEHNSSELIGNNKADNKKTERTTCHTGLSWQKAFLMNKELLVNAAYKVDIQRKIMCHGFRRGTSEDSSTENKAYI